MQIQVLLAPYDSGHREWRMGRGPAHLVRHGVASNLRALGHDVDAEYCAPPRGDETIDRPLEISTSFALYRDVARRARLARERDALPLIFGGNCGVTLAALAASDGAPGVLWLDAHGDLNSPETSTSGFLDGMSLAALIGRAWKPLTASIPGFRPIPEAHVVLAGVRDLDDDERTLIEGLALTVVPGSVMHGARGHAALVGALDTLRSRCDAIHVHLDCDVIDAAVARANHFAVPGGPDVADLVNAMELVAARFRLASASVTAFDPEVDVSGAVPTAVVAALEALVTEPMHRG